MMSRGVELPWSIMGRRIRPFSFGLMLSCIVIMFEFFDTQHGPGSGITEDLAGAMCFATAVLLTGGWLFKNDHVHDWGLLFAAGVWGGRASLYVTEERITVGFYLSLIWMLMALGAYALERYDHKWQYHRRVDDD